MLPMDDSDEEATLLGNVERHGRASADVEGIGGSTQLPHLETSQVRIAFTLHLTTLLTLVAPILDTKAPQRPTTVSYHPLSSPRCALHFLEMSLLTPV